MNVPTTQIRQHRQVPFTVITLVGGGRLTLQLVGELDLACVELLEQCDHDPDQSIRDVVVDVAQLSFIDTAGVGALIALRQRQRSRGREVRVVGAGRLVRKVIGLCGPADLLAEVPESRRGSDLRRQTRSDSSARRSTDA